MFAPKILTLQSKIEYNTPSQVKRKKIAIWKKRGNKTMVR